SRAGALPPNLLAYHRDCVREAERRQQRRLHESRFEPWTGPIYRRSSYLERLLNHLLTVPLHLPADPWISLRYAPDGWLTCRRWKSGCAGSLSRARWSSCVPGTSRPQAMSSVAASTANT